MTSFSTTLDEPAVSRGNQDGPPPIFGGGDDGRSGPGVPDYPTRLRRARLGLLVAFTPVLVLFVFFTIAYVVRQGLPTFDPRTNPLVRERFLRFDDAKQLVRLFADGSARSSLDGWRPGAAGSGAFRFVPQASDDAQHRCGRRGMVLAFHGRTLGLHFAFAGVCTIAG